jgi:hypothetical protein
MATPRPSEKAGDLEKVDIDELYNSGQTSVASDSGINEKAFIRKLDRKLLPGVIVLYLLSFLDRSNGDSIPELVSSSQTNLSCSRKRSC